MSTHSRLRILLLSSVGMLSASPAWATDYPIATGSTSSSQISVGGTDTVTVNGTLSVNDTAIKWNNASTALAITNNGTIQSTASGGRAINAGGSATAPRVVTLTNNGLITAQDDAIRINVDITQGSVNLVNTGSIISTLDGQAIDFDAVASTPNGAITITNLASGIILSTDADAVRPGQGAVVDNAGLIYAGAVTNTSSDGVDFQSHSGTVINEVGGTISGARHGITTDGDVNVTNYGTIIGRNGSGVGSDGTGTVYNYGTIIGAYDGSGTGDGDGVDIDGYAYVYNNGTIEGTGAAGTKADGRANSSEGVALSNGGTVYNDTNGVISGVDVGITACCSVSNVFDITNKGSVYGGNHGIGIDGVGSIVNYGTIGAGGYAIDVLNSAQSTTVVTIDNYGSIAGSYGALYIQSNASVALTMESGASLGGVITVDGALKFIENADYSLSSAIGGAGSLTKTGTATLTLTGANTYAGGTTVTQGTLSIAGGGTLGDVSGATTVTGATLDLGGTTQTQNGGVTLTGGTIQNGTLSTSGTYTMQGGTISAALTGSGNLVQVSGTTTLYGANSYTGGTTISGGTLWGTTASLQGAILDNGALVFAQNGSGTYAGSISGSGTLTVSTAGTVTLTGANTYAGGTTINGGGTLALAGNGTLGAASGAVTVNGASLDLGGGTVVQNGGVTVTNAGTIQNGTVSTSGTFNLQGGSITASLAGTGNLVQSSGATLLGAVNTYSGGTTISGGILGLVGSGTLGTGPTSISAGLLDLGGATLQTAGLTVTGGTIENGTLVSSGTFTVTGGTLSTAVTGSGMLVKDGADVLTLTGANSYTGGTTISGGTLKGSTTSLQGPILNNATLEFAQASDGSYGGAISGSGALVKSGSGSLSLTGANSYTGGTTISGGTLKGSTTSLQGPILDNATLEFVQSSDGSYGGAISGSGVLVKSASGSLSLTGASSITGSTTVSGGRLAINGTLATGGLTVQSGATLGGSGTISSTGGVTIASGATLSPGNSPGTLTVNGNLTLASGATTAIDIDGATWTAAGGAGSYDRLVVNGTFTAAGTLSPVLRGITGSATNSYTPTLGTRFTIVTANAVNGSFGSITQPTTGLAANTRLDAIYGATTVQLAVTPVSFATLGATSGWNANMLSTAVALDSVRSSNSSAALFSNLYGLDAAGYGRSVSQLSGQVYADALQGFASAAETTLDLVRDQAAHGGPVGARSTSGVELWTRFVHTSEAPGDSGVGNGYSANTNGFVTGVTLITEPRLHFGLAGGYTYTKINTGLGASSGGSGAVGYAYGNFAITPIFDLTVVGGVATASLGTSRSIATTGDTATAHGSSHTVMIQFAADARLRALRSGGLSLYGLAGIETGFTHSSQINESASNSAFALTLPRSDWNTVDARLGGQVVQHLAGASLSAYGTWLQQLADAPAATRQVSLDGAGWAVRSTGMARSGLGYGAAANVQLTPRLSVQASYDGVNRGQGYHNDRFSAGVSFAF